MLKEYKAACPYCGECFSTVLDLSALDTNLGEHDYIEDCQVCCRPIRFVITTDNHTEQTNIELRRDDD